MIHHLDKALEAFLRQQVPLPEADIDISFRAPDGSWTASIARPTIDVFLWDVARAARTSSTGRDERISEDGRRQQRLSPTQVALRYFVTVWAREQRDEHELLGAILRTVLGHDELPRSLLPPALADTPCRLVLAGDQQRLPPALWGGAPIKPGLYVEVELGVDASGWSDRGAPVEAMHVQVSDQDAGRPAAAAAPAGTEVPAGTDGPAGGAAGGTAPTHGTPAAAGAPDADDRPPLRRFRSGGALVMEGRPEGRGEPDAPQESGRK